MFFPYNIDSQVKSKSKVDSGTQRSFFLTLFFIGMIVLYFIARDILVTQFGLPWFVSIAVTLLISFLVGFSILRIFVFNEKFLVESEEDSKSDSLGKYYKIRESELPQMIDGIEVFENNDGILCACVEILYGPNSRDKSEFTLSYLESIFNNISQFSTDFKVYITKENFLRSQECKNFLRTVNNDSNKQLKPLISEISDLILGYTAERSFLYSTFIIIRFPTISSNSLKGLKVKLDDIVSESVSSIRSIEFVDRSRFREFIRDYNLVEALDLSNYKSSNLPSNIYRKYKNSIFVIEGTDTKYEYKNGVKMK